MQSIRVVFDQLLWVHGPQHWWPAEHPFEIIVGALLVQQTNWGNVETAVERLRANRLLDCASLSAVDPERLQEILKPTGFFRSKAARLKRLARFILAAGGIEALNCIPTDRLRRVLLALDGIGPETADSILLYSFRRPVAVIDAYTRRLFSRLTGEQTSLTDEQLRDRVLSSLSAAEELNEFHALVVAHGKSYCRKRPACSQCCLRPACALGNSAFDT